MKAVMVIYLTITMFFTIIESEGYYGASYTNIQSEYVISTLENSSQTGSVLESLINPLFAPMGLLKTFLSIVYRSLTFQFDIEGAPDVVNFMIKWFFGVLAWIALWDLIQIIVQILSIISRTLLSFLSF